MVQRERGLDAADGDGARDIGESQARQTRPGVRAGDSAGLRGLPGDGGGLGVGGSLHDDAQVAGEGVAGDVGRSRCAVGLAEVDAVLDAGDLASVGQPVAAERGVVQAVMGIGADQVQRGGLRRGRSLAGEVAEHGDGGVHLDVPVALGGVVGVSA